MINWYLSHSNTGATPASQAAQQLSLIAIIEIVINWSKCDFPKQFSIGISQNKYLVQSVSIKPWNML